MSGFEFIPDDSRFMPKRLSSGAVGYDCFAAEPTVIAPKDFEIVDLGFKVRMAPTFELQVRSRSGLAAKHGVFVLNAPGTIDPDYTGSVKAILAVESCVTTVDPSLK